MNIDDLRNLSNFDLETEGLGPIRIGQPAHGVEKELAKQMAIEPSDRVSVTRRTLGACAHKYTGDDRVDKAAGGPLLSDSELGEIKVSELEQFAKKLAKVRYGSQSREHSTQDNGIDFLFEEMAAAKEYQTKLMRNLVTDARQIFQPSTLDALAQNAALSASLQRSASLIGDPTRALASDRVLPHLPSLAGAPAIETNKVLKKCLALIEEARPVFGQCVQLIASMNTTALQMQADSTENSQKAESVANKSIELARKSISVAVWSIWISFLALVISTGLTLYDMAGDDDSNGTTHQLLRNLNEKMESASTESRQLRLRIDQQATEMKRMDEEIKRLRSIGEKRGSTGHLTGTAVKAP